MNERIRELAKLADSGYTGNSEDGLGASLVGNHAIEKFAELIVRECVEICMKEFDTGLLMAPQAPWIAKQIREHFGVEE
jgi:hypothetical protein